MNYISQTNSMQLIKPLETFKIWQKIQKKFQDTLAAAWWKKYEKPQKIIENLAKTPKMWERRKLKQ